eukprot:PITA_13188
MALMSGCVVTETSSFEETMQQPVWVDAMAEEYDSIVKNSVLDVVPRLADKSVEPCTWYTRIDSYFIELGSTKIEAYTNLYHIVVEGKLLIIVLYVDDLILKGDDKLIKPCKEDLAREFEMKDLGLMQYFMGMEVQQGDEEIFVSQGKYANEILKKFHMESSKPMETPLAGNWRKEDATSCEVVEATIYRQLVHSLMYLVNTQLDMCYAVNHLS